MVSTMPGRFTPGKDPIPIVQEAGWAVLDGCGKSPLPGFDPRTVQPVASRCTDCAIPWTPNRTSNLAFIASKPIYGYQQIRTFNTVHASLKLSDLLALQTD